MLTYKPRDVVALIGAVNVSLMLAAPANAQEGSSDHASLEEVIVNARRVEENVQRVPIAIAALSEAALERQDIIDLSGLQKTTPGLYLPGSGPGRVITPFLRGVKGVVAYFADSPITVMQGANNTAGTGFGYMFDVENVQVLKGPQGTLFGTATNGGAILYTPRKPTTTSRGDLSGVAGTDGRIGLEGAVNVAMLEDKLLLRVAGAHGYAEGYVKDLTSGAEYGEQDYWVGRVTAIVRPTEKFENSTVFQYYKDTNTPTAFGLTDINRNSLAYRVYGASMDAALETQRRLGPYTVPGLSAGAGQGGIRGSLEIYNLVNTTQFEFSDAFTLKNIAGYQSYKVFAIGDTDGTSLPINEGSGLASPQDPIESWSEELQGLGTLMNGSLRYTVGAFASETGNGDSTNYSVAFGNLSKTQSHDGGHSRALYAQGTYEFGSIEGLSLTAGYRYTWDQRHGRVARLNPNTDALISSAGGEARFQAGTYMVSLAYQLNPSTMFFITNSKGYSSGQVQSDAPPEFQAVQPESLNNFEAGVKSTFDIGDWTMRTNFSGFYGIFEDVQASVITTAQLLPPPAPPQLVVLLRNAAEGRVRGFDAEFTVVPSPAIELTARAGYTSNYYTKYLSTDTSGNPVNLSSTPFTYVPELIYSVDATYRFPIAEASGDVSLTVAYSHVDSTPVASNPRELLAPEDYYPAFENLDATLSWTNLLGYKDLDLALLATNLTDNTQGAAGCTCYSTALGLRNHAIMPPSRYALRLSYRF